MEKVSNSVLFRFWVLSHTLLQVTLLRAGRRCRRKVVAGDLVAIQYEGRLEGEEGSLFHATRPTQPFVFVVRTEQHSSLEFSFKQINCHFLLTQVQDGRALPGIVAGLYQMLTIVFWMVFNISSSSSS